MSKSRLAFLTNLGYTFADMMQNQIDQKTIEQFKLLTDQATKILLTTHRYPDEDAIGSILSAFSVLKTLYPQKEIRMMVSSVFNNRWQYFENIEKVEVVEDISTQLDNFDLLIITDCTEHRLYNSNPKNIEDKIAELKPNGLKSVVIDHHRTPNFNYDLIIQDPNATSATEMVYFLLCQNLPKIESRLAETLLLGILGDSDNLRFVKPEQVYIYPIIQRLVSEGNINVQDLEARHLNYPLSVIEIVKEFVKNMTIAEIPGWPNFVYSFIDKNYFDQNNLKDADISNASNFFLQTYGFSIKEAPWGLAISPRANGQISVGSRSRLGGVNVRLLMEGIGIGGGHNRAAGGRILPKENQSLDWKDCFDLIVDWMKNHPHLKLD